MKKSGKSSRQLRVELIFTVIAKPIYLYAACEKRMTQQSISTVGGQKPCFIVMQWQAKTLFFICAGNLTHFNLQPGLFKSSKVNKSTIFQVKSYRNYNNDVGCFNCEQVQCKKAPVQETGQARCSERLHKLEKVQRLCANPCVFFIDLIL